MLAAQRVAKGDQGQPRATTLHAYAIAAGGNASHGADDSTIKVILVVIAALQSLIFFL